MKEFKQSSSKRTINNITVEKPEIKIYFNGRRWVADVGNRTWGSNENFYHLVISLKNKSIISPEEFYGITRFFKYE